MKYTCSSTVISTPVAVDQRAAHHVEEAVRSFTAMRRRIALYKLCVKGCHVIPSKKYSKRYPPGSDVLKNINSIMIPYSNVTRLFTVPQEEILKYSTTDLEGDLVKDYRARLRNGDDDIIESHRLVAKVTDSWTACHEFDPSAAEDPPCREAMHVKSVESSNVLPLVWCGAVEFGKKLNQAQLHKELQHRKMRPNETVFQYLVAIRELANRGQGFLDETSIMEYCINGIPDSPSNKLILYGCTTIQEFKEKLGIYDKIFQNKSKNHSYDTSRSPNFSSQRRDVESTLHKHRNDRYPKFNAPKPNSKFENKNFRDRNHVTCFNCSGSGHISKFCPDKHRGPKCILCENFGHKSDACPQKISLLLIMLMKLPH
ncbi:uncharacterized protein TNCV_4604821 [Trichonephila clavipes]|nr:uncharacterized protein TNCV_4604821 [Trichonephila clavipes]